MMRTTFGVSAKKQDGLATVEFVLCAPILLLLMFATADIGRLLFQYNALNKSVRDGARYAIGNAQYGSTGTVNISNIINATRNLVVTGNIAGTGTALLPGLVTDNVSVTNVGSVYVSVSATYKYRPMLGSSLPSFGFGNAVNLALPLNATVVMRAL